MKRKSHPKEEAKPNQRPKPRLKLRPRLISSIRLLRRFRRPCPRHSTREKVPVRAMVTKGKVRESLEIRRTIPKLNAGPVEVYISNSYGRRAHVPT